MYIMSVRMYVHVYNECSECGYFQHHYATRVFISKTMSTLMFYVLAKPVMNKSSEFLHLLISMVNLGTLLERKHMFTAMQFKGERYIIVCPVRINVI